MEVINAHPELSIAAKFISKAKFDVKLRNNAEPFTVFIPNNDAFKNLEATIDSMPIEGKYGIAEIIGRHTVAGHGRIMSTKLNERNGWMITIDNYLNICWRWIFVATSIFSLHQKNSAKQLERASTNTFFPVFFLRRN